MSQTPLRTCESCGRELSGWSRVCPCQAVLVHQPVAWPETRSWDGWCAVSVALLLGSVVLTVAGAILNSIR